ncbi:MAG: cobalamin biosynthesis protein CobD [Treponema sp.]|nr:cobalamin biosynthesis protein CobD [Treponema sp.]
MEQFLNADTIFSHHVACSLLVGFFLDCILGDPHFFPHPVRCMGKLIACLEKRLNHSSDSPKVQRLKGALLVLVVISVTFLASFLFLLACKKINSLLFFSVESVMCYFCLASKSLYTESSAVYVALKKGKTEEARAAVSMIVGRDTDILDEQGIAKAAVETVAESTNDGCIAPLIFMTVFGVAGGMVYKAINTMDSMIAYKNERFLHFGFCAAKLDDVANFIPSRICALCMILVSFLLPRFSGKNALRIFLRDRHKHASPNSAQTESVCAGALGIRLAGDTVYNGIVEKKEFIGDKLREIEAKDILKANILMWGTTVLLLAGCVMFAFFVWGALHD